MNHSAKQKFLYETQRNIHADIEWDDGETAGCLLKFVCFTRRTQKELKKKKKKKIAEIKAKTGDIGDLVAFMYDALRGLCGRVY